MDEFKREKKVDLIIQGLELLKLGIPDPEKADHIVELIEQYRKLR